MNILMVGKGIKPTGHQSLWFEILKGLEESGKFSVTYNQLGGKIQGMKIDEVYIDEFVQS